MKDVVILGGMRTPMGEYNGSLSDFSAIELGAIAGKAALQKTGVSPEEVQHVVFGNALQTSGDAIYGARHVALKSGIPVAGSCFNSKPFVRFRNSSDCGSSASDSAPGSGHRAGRWHGITKSSATRDSRSAQRACGLAKDSWKIH